MCTPGEEERSADSALVPRMTSCFRSESTSIPADTDQPKERGSSSSKLPPVLTTVSP